VYADWTASGRALAQVEDYIRHQVLPLYANTHTETSITGSFTTLLRENARKLIARASHCTDEDVVMFTGNGSTAAINDFVQLLELEKKCMLYHHHQGVVNKDTDKDMDNNLPLVLISSYEHHSNILPWRECGAEVVEVPESSDTGSVDLIALENILIKHKHRKTIIGSFSAGSNVTGICSNVKAIAILLHQYKALACFDYACVAPYLGIEMNWTVATSRTSDSDRSDVDTQSLAYLDAVYISTHKFTGGVGATGLLIAKRKILTRQVPVSPGGGTVLFVSSEKQTYLDDIVSREEAGTPNIIGNAHTRYTHCAQHQFTTFFVCLFIYYY
jgi:selenocysteine lyase/cysteine desulfurase